MAEAILTTVVDRLSLLIEKEVNRLGGVKEQILSLQKQLLWMRGFLRDAEDNRKNNQVLEIWVASVKHLAYRVEDVINAYNLDMERRKKSHILLRIIGFWKRPKALHRFGKEIEGIDKEAIEIASNKSLYFLDIPKDRNDSNLAAIRKNAFDDEQVTVGFHKQAEKLIDSLVMKEKKPRRRIMSIVGMGGLGKTTLAKMIYGRREVKNHFNARAMTYASQEYQVKDLLLSIIKQVSGAITTEELGCLQDLNEGDLKLELKKHLQGKRYLVVIDDVWKKETWIQIRGAFPEDGNGSRVLLTTRNEDVAIHADPSTPRHDLPLMNKDESWELFCTKVFSAPGSCPPELVEVGEKIVMKCRGLPLAIVVLGGIVLGKDRNKKAWSKVLKCVTFELTQDSNHCQAILALSYIDLPKYLKSCFLYLGIFPEDFEIDAKKLTLLWVAQDFVQMRGEQNAEDVAEDCLIELIHRSLIQVSKRRYHGGPAETCRVHDLLRDLAISKGKMFLDIHGYKHTASSSSTLSAIESVESTANVNVSTSFDIKLRSLLFFKEGFKLHSLQSTFGDRIELLRVLDLNVPLGGCLPSYIGRLTLLQYLGLRDTVIDEIPSSICNLVNLQTLDARHVYINIRMPKEIWKMQQLKHFYLETYSWVNLGAVDSIDIECLPRNLLTLEISCDIWTRFGEKGLSKAFVEFDCLQSLTLRGALNVRDLPYCFPLSLTELDLEACVLKTDPSHVLEGLPNLMELRIRNGSYIGKEMLFSAQGFKQLQFLQLHELGSWQVWTVEDGAMSNLKHLVLSECESLKMLPDGLKNVTTLRKLEMLLMPKKIRDRVQQNGEDWDKIQHVPEIVCTA